MKELQSGRSMIEMLGVLAIIGVLSIGGLAGYTMAMNRHRANTLMDYVSRCAVTAQTYGVDGDFTKNCGELLTNEEAPNGLAKTSFTMTSTTTDFTITAPAVSTAVFEALKARSGASVTIAGTEAAPTFKFTK